MLISYLVNRLFNPTRSWPPVQEDAASGNSLCFDLDRGELNGIACGQSLEKLQFLGPAKRNIFYLHWPALGLGLNWIQDKVTQQRHITTFTFYFDHADLPEEGGFPGSFRYQDRKLPLNRELTPSHALEIFGEPAWRNDEDEDEEINLIFEPNSQTEWDFEFGEDRKLKCFIMEAD